MSEEIAKVAGELREAFSSLDQKSKDFDEYKQVSKTKYEELEKKLFDLETKNQELASKELAAEKKSAEMLEKLELLEKKATRPNASQEDKIEVKAFENYILKGAQAVKEMEVKTLRTDINADGGFLTKDPEILEDIIKDITEISPVRSLARVRRTNTESLKVRKRASLLNSVWKGQLEESVTSNSQYGMLEIPVNKLPVTVDVTREMLMYGDVNIVSEIQQDVVEDFAENEGFAFVLGDGVKKPEGFLVNSDTVANAITSTSSGVIDGDDFALLMTSLKSGYNPVFGFNRTTWGQVVNLKDSGGQYLINFGDLSAGVSATLRGVRYVIMQDLPNVSAGNLAVVCADFNKGYVVADGTSLEVIRDEYSRKKEGVVEFQFTRYVGGQVVQPEAFALLSIKA